MEKWYSGNVILLLKNTLYGLKQAAYRFWSHLLTLVHHVQFSRSKADPCLYFKWTETGALLLWFSWVDDCIVNGSEAEILKAKSETMSQVDCEDGGELKEFVGCKIDHDRSQRALKFTQPVLLQSFTDEFLIAQEKDAPTTPGIPLKTLQLGNATQVKLQIGSWKAASLICHDTMPTDQRSILLPCIVR
jgi:hypothetical protein